MSIYSCHISNVSRAKGSSSCATLSYISAEKVREDRTGELYQYGRSERVMEVGTILPKGAPSEYQDPKKLFNAIENYETASNARTAKKIMVALPREFDLEKQKEVIENYIKENITAQGYACTYAIHIDKENSNPHAHILIANRQINDRGEWSTKSRKEYALDEKGERIPQLDENGEQKLGKRNEKLWKRVSVQVNPLDKKETLENLREGWAVECNKHLAQEQQIDHRSLAEQGKEEEPTIHEGYVARKIEKQGGVSELCEQNRQITQRNNLLKQIQAELKNIKEKLSAFVQEKGASINDRIGELLKRRNAIKSGRGITDGERATAIPDRTVAEPSGAVQDTDTANLIREARAEIADSRTAEKNSGAERANREAERERQRAAAKQSVLERERAEALRKSKMHERSRGFER